MYVKHNNIFVILLFNIVVFDVHTHLPIYLQGGVFKCLPHIKLDGIKNPCFFTFMSQFAKMGTF